MKTETLNPPLRPGDMIEVGFRSGGQEYWIANALAVRQVALDGTPYVRYRFGKVDKPVQLWRKPDR